MIKREVVAKTEKFKDVIVEKFKCFEWTSPMARDDISIKVIRSITARRASLTAFELTCIDCKIAFEYGTCKSILLVTHDVTSVKWTGKWAISRWSRRELQMMRIFRTKRIWRSMEDNKSAKRAKYGRYYHPEKVIDVHNVPTSICQNNYQQQQKRMERQVFCNAKTQSWSSGERSDWQG